MESAAKQAVSNIDNIGKQTRLVAGAYPYNIIENTNKDDAAAQYHIAVKDMLKELVTDKSNGKSINLIAWQFHL